MFLVCFGHLGDLFDAMSGRVTQKYAVGGRQRVSVLVGIEKICPHCQRTFRYCQHCWRGHKYCGPHCSLEGRRKNRRASEKKYALTDRGRENRCLRQKNFRIRKILKIRVTHHSPLKPTHRVNSFKRELDEIANNCLHCKRSIRIINGGRNREIASDLSEESDYFSFTRFRKKFV